jgi:hypothetical protein
MNMTILAPNTVLVTSEGLRAMRKAWPCSGLPSDLCVSFQFDSHGLCDIGWYDTDGLDVEEPQGVDGGCMVALSQDAEAFLGSQQSECA